jgi:hypothetical protein
MGKAERISAVIVVGCGVLVAAYSYYTLKLGMMISPGAGFLPFLLGIALIILGVLWFIQKSLTKIEVTAHAAPEGSSGPEGLATGEGVVCGLSKKMLLGIAVLIVYASLFEWIGYFVATLIFMFSWQMCVEKEKWMRSLLITALSTAAMYTLFRYLLNVQLPRGPWF